MKTLVIACCYNEGQKIQAQLRRYPRERDYQVLIVDDGSTDASLENAADFGAEVISHKTNLGAGASLKTGFHYAIDHGFEVIVVMAGNNKDDPSEIPRLLDRIREGFDFVQGSRFLKAGKFGNMPIYRRCSTRFHAVLFSIVVGKWLTESTNGFRAFRTSLLGDPAIDWRQDWLDRYELEPYLLYKAIRLGYRVTEVPVTKIYPPKSLGYTKMKPITGWWSILRPLFLLSLRLRK